MITSNSQAPTPQVEPQKLNVITTAQIGNEKPAETKGLGAGKMITTHELPDTPVAVAPVAAGGWKVVVDESAGPGAATWMDKQFKADAAAGKPEEPKKPARGKKAE